jgi:hypothetical protein
VRYLLVPLAMFAAAAASADLSIALSADSPALRFGAGELQRALEARGIVSKVAAAASGDITPRVDPSAVDGQAEAFVIRKDGDRIVVIGDEIGAMYGLIDVGETVALGGLESVEPKRARPFLAMRGIKWNLPLAGGAYAGAEGGRPGEWLWNRDFWEQFLQMMARNRYNVLTLWNGCPYHQLVHLDDIADATDVPREQIDANIEFFRWATRRARELGIQTHLITWNIHVPPSFAKAHGIEAAGVDSPEVRDYIRRAVRALIDTYPDLTVIGTCPGEQMKMSAQEKQDWIAGTYLAGMRDASRTVPFFLRYWQGDPAATATMLDREKWPAPVYVSVKFNGEHMYSSPRFHLQDHRWLDMAGKRWKVFWHLRNDCLFRLQWGDPEFVRATVRNCKAPYSCGFFWGSEGLKPGADSSHKPASDAYAKYEWEFLRKAEMYRLWGRLGYDPETPEDVLSLDYRRTFGSAAEESAEALAQASRVIPLTTSLHWNYMNGDWQPEYNTGSWNTSYEMSIRSFRDKESFHSVKEFIFNDVIDDSLCNIPDFVALQMTGRPLQPGRLSPLDAARQIVDAADAAESHIIAARQALGKADPEFACLEGDVRIQAELGRYYGKKIAAATDVARVMIAGDESARPEAVRLLEECARHWRNVADVGAEQYPTTNWRDQIPQVQADIEFARAVQPLPRMATTWQVAAVTAGAKLPEDAGKLTWRDVQTGPLVEEGEAQGLGPWLDRLNAALGAETVDLRRTAGAAGSAAFAVKRRFDAAAAGVADLVIRTDHPTTVWVNGEPCGTADRPSCLTAAVRQGANETLAEVRVPRDARATAFGLEVSVLPAAGIVARLECEKAEALTAPMVVAKDPGCSGGACVQVPRDAGRGDDAQGKPIEHGRMTFTFPVEEEGRYDVWVRVLWPATTANSYFIRMDDGEIAQFGQDEVFGRWHWVKSKDSYALKPGKHTLILRTRETNTRGDVIAIARAQ